MQSIECIKTALLRKKKLYLDYYKKKGSLCESKNNGENIRLQN